ncbi:MAG: PEP-CTERM sorting domain-containing protein [Deltaproteobacteria bacterium]|nr:PEP-CTERM sorting domain-containing protein [Deltaproteobacteria bacterium]MBW2495700.1 PEP-CTERM sorting domain-containing protein [Deltaproteobacteria bacterium]
MSRHPNAGNLAFWLADLRLGLTLPESAAGLALVAGATALVMLARRRRS